MEGNEYPLVSVVMSFHNAKDLLSFALHSLLWQTYPHWELILMDDGSSDGSVEFLKTIDDPRIRLYRDAVCRGLPVQLNRGVALAQGEFIARMDADDVAFPERLERQVAYLQEHRDVDLLATSALLVNGNNNPIGVLPTKLSHEDICRRPWLGFPMPHPTWMGRAEWFRRHPYDESARKGQDQVLLYETYQNSKFAGLPDTLLGYKYAGLSVQKTLIGRYCYLKAISAKDVRNWLLGNVSHAIAAARDLLALALGMESHVIKSRVKMADADTLSEWKELRRRLSDISRMAGT
ncbi:MAG: glycosyltransferase family 2 protein [Rugosibacter sp.]|nr:glycosyltransferase family 2 protein [Rugosibacter sp.]